MESIQAVLFLRERVNTLQLDNHMTDYQPFISNLFHSLLGGFCSLGWAVMSCRLLLAVWLVLTMWAGLTGFVWLATVVLLVMKSI